MRSLTLRGGLELRRTFQAWENPTFFNFDVLVLEDAEIHISDLSSFEEKSKDAWEQHARQQNLGISAGFWNLILHV